MTVSAALCRRLWQDLVLRYAPRALTKGGAHTVRPRVPPTQDDHVLAASVNALVLRHGLPSIDTILLYEELEG